MLERCRTDGADMVMPSNLGARSATYTVDVTGRTWGIWCWDVGDREAGDLLRCCRGT